MSRARAIAVLLLLAVGCACGGAATTGEPSGGARGAPSGGASGGGSPAEPSHYAVHEWGLVRAGAGDTLVVGALGPPAPPTDLIAVEKPVLYFHLDGAGPLELASVRVEALGGAIVEHWPHTGAAATPPPASVAWTHLRLEPGTCALVPPTGAERPCSDLDAGEVCESAALAPAATTDGACLRGAHGAAPLLFYRSTATAVTVPLVATAAGRDFAVRNDGSSPIPGSIVRFQRDGAAVRVIVAAPPPPGASIAVDGAWEAPAAARTAVTETLTGLGLTPAEAAAFLASWDAAFFGAPPSEIPPGAEDATERAVEESPPPEESLLYFLPADDVEHISRLAFDPAPTEVRRAMAVWSAVR